jgi:sterol desaturase/sphingolipid hydroxylase (fatty acid hydroxylase superfamily)
MQRATSTTTASAIRLTPTTTPWDAKEKTSSFPLKKEAAASAKKHEATVSSSNNNNNKGSFYDQQTLWDQELHRYHPSFWTLFRVTSLILFPYLMSAVGYSVWPHVIQVAISQELDVNKFASGVIGAIVFSWFLGHNTLYAVLYYYEPSFLKQYRVDDKPWHWDMDPMGWKTMLRSTIGNILFNFVCVTGSLMFLVNRYMGGLPFRLDDTSLPSGSEILGQLILCMILEDFAFHHTHQLLHTKQLYWIHKLHHKYHASISIAAVHAHPIEFMVGNLLPSLLGPLLLQQRMHRWSFCVWAVFRSSAALENHSGYEFPWSLYQAIPFKAPTEYHDFHHNRNLETYSGVLRFWDMVYGTNQHYFEWVRAGRPDTIKAQKFKEQQQQQKQKQKQK